MRVRGALVCLRDDFSPADPGIASRTIARDYDYLRRSRPKSRNHAVLIRDYIPCLSNCCSHCLGFGVESFVVLRVAAKFSIVTAKPFYRRKNFFLFFAQQSLLLGHNFFKRANTRFGSSKHLRLLCLSLGASSARLRRHRCRPCIAGRNYFLPACEGSSSVSSLPPSSNRLLVRFAVTFLIGSSEASALVSSSRALRLAI